MYKAQSLGGHDTSPSSAAAVFGTALLFTRYQPPDSGLPCVEDTLSFTREGEESPGAPARKNARRRGVTWCPCTGKRAKARSHLVPLREKAREGEESPGAPARKKRARARSHLMPRRAPYQPSRFRWTITSVVHAPTKWCSTRSYSIGTVRSDRCWRISAQNRAPLTVVCRPHRLKKQKKQKKKQQTVRSRSSLAHRSSQCRDTLTHDCFCQEPDVRGKV